MVKNLQKKLEKQKAFEKERQIKLRLAIWWQKEVAMSPIRIRYWAFVSALQTSLNIGKLYLSLVDSQAAVPGGRISNSTKSPSDTGR